MYRLKGLSSSYFTRKLESALKWYKCDFIFENKKFSFRQMGLSKEAGTNRIPVLYTPGNQCYEDSTPIMKMMDRSYPERRMFPEGMTGVYVHALENYLDEWSPRAAIHYRWHYKENTEKAKAKLAKEIAPFFYMAPLRRGIANSLEKWGTSACKHYGIVSETQMAAGEKELFRLYDHLEVQLTKTKFSLGSRPCAVDATIIGGLLGHFIEDPCPKSIIESKYPVITKWAKGEAFNWDGSGKIDFPEMTDFGGFLIKEMSGPYVSYAKANAIGLQNKDKYFNANIYGETVSFRSRKYTEISRLMVVEHFESLSEQDKNSMRLFFEQHNLKLLTER